MNKRLHIHEFIWYLLMVHYLLGIVLQVGIMVDNISTNNNIVNPRPMKAQASTQTRMGSLTSKFSPTLQYGRSKNPPGRGDNAESTWVWGAQVQRFQTFRVNYESSWCRIDMNQV